MPIYFQTRWLRVIVPTFVVLLVLAIGIAYLRTPQATLEKPPQDAPYRLSSSSIDVRIEDLLARMTLDEKIGQMALVEKNSVHDVDDIASYGIGAMLSGMGAKPEPNTPSGWLNMVGSFQRSALSSRLGIPLLYGADAIHGHSNVFGATMFPHMIGLGATRDADLVERVARATAEEMEATGIYWTYSPNLDLPRDIRWGRTYEAFTDDPTLAGELGAAYVRGTQGSGSSMNVIATAKHYLGIGAMQWGSSSNKNFKIDQGRTPSSTAALQEEYLPPYRAVVDAGVGSVMIGLNSWDGTWASYDKNLITGSLKGDLGFSGFVISDWYAVYEHSFTQYEGLVKSINAGVDMVMLPFDYKGFLMNMRLAVKTGDIPQARIDDAVRRILRAKFQAGLFERPLASESELSVIGSSEHHAIAREAVSKSLVLLKNDQDLLPLSPKMNHLRIAGSAADNVGRQSGAWTVEWRGIDGNWLEGGTSILQGIKNAVSSSTTVEYDREAKFVSAKRANVGIAIVGEKPYAEGWGDDANPSLAKEDLETIDRLRASCDRVIVVLVSGRPLMIADKINDWDALVEAWLPGSEGEGVADVLFGKQPFVGKLPLPWPASVKQLPISVDGKTKDGTKVLFPRGFGIHTEKR
ncbi:MAG: glycoside hydrolase family 3 C-terminal domain-containing protein [Candidatus Uhrbacteria bacterium]|nr:glycoside hydrolase family 3 C-terminal domain-containing protein [Candidatus Uhrbacteria bacterium]